MTEGQDTPSRLPGNSISKRQDSPIRLSGHLILQVMNAGSTHFSGPLLKVCQRATPSMIATLQLQFIPIEEVETFLNSLDALTKVSSHNGPVMKRHFTTENDPEATVHTFVLECPARSLLDAMKSQHENLTKMKHSTTAYPARVDLHMKTFLSKIWRVLKEVSVSVQ